MDSPKDNSKPDTTFKNVEVAQNEIGSSIQKDSKSFFEKKSTIIIIVVVVLILICYNFYGKSSAKYDYLIVGAGLYGATFAHFLRKQGKSVLIVEKRDNIGGNIYCEDQDGIIVHKYGPHVFHTDNKKVWDFVNNLVPFTPFQINTLANYEDKLYNLPFNMNTFYQLWGVKTPEEAQEKIASQKYKGEVKNLEEQALSLVGTDVYEKLIKGYTEKQWGRDCKNLPTFIIKRLPVRYTYNNNYFNDRYQGIPEGGYNAVINKLVEGCDIKTNVDYIAQKDKYKNVAKNILFTGKIDEYYNFKYGKLEYRTVRWENEVINKKNYQGNVVINYTSKNVPYTRIIEHKHFEPYNKKVQELEKTVISKEFSEEWTEGKECYYPVNDEKNNNLFKKYRELADKETNLIFGGRLGNYKYYDMKDAIEAVFKIFNY